MGELHADRGLALMTPDIARPGGALVAAALISLAVFAAFHLISPLSAVENRARDLIHGLAYPSAPPREDIAVVLIDEATVEQFAYRQPIDRLFLAELIRSLREKGARAIGIDLLIDQLTEDAKDFALFDVMAEPGAPVVFVVADETEGLSRTQTETLAAITADVPVGQAAVLRDPTDFVTRAVPATRDVGGRSAPSLSVAMARAAGIDAPDGAFDIAFVPPEQGQSFAPRLIAGFHGLFADEAIRDRFIFVGVDLQGIDRHRTPLEALSGEADRPGVESHAQALATLLDGRRLVETAPLWELVGACLAAVTTVGALFIPAPVVGRLALAAMVALTFLAFPAAALSTVEVRAPVLPTITASLTAGVAVALARWRADAATRRRLREAFSRYLAPAMVRDLERRPEALALGGEKRVITCVFTDVAGFTSICEGLGPEELVSLLNRYLGGAARVVVDHGGTIDKFQGDAVVSFFNAPLDREDHAAAAIRMAAALDAYSQAFIAEMAAEGQPFGVTRIGVHTGEATVGNFGGDVFFDYTAMGDTVNSAARLEGANKAYGGRLTISSDALAAAGGSVDSVATRPIGRLVVKGRAQPMMTFEAFPPNDPRAEYVTEFDEAYAKMTDGDPDAFAALAARYPEDGLVAMHAERGAAGEAGDVVTLKEK